MPRLKKRRKAVRRPRVTGRRVIPKRTRTKKKLKFGTRVRNAIRKRVCPRGTTPLMDGENHFACSNYMGPGTRYRVREKMGIKGVNSADEASRRHDRDFTEIGEAYRAGRITKTKAMKLAHAADKRMISTLKSDRLAGKNKTVYDKLSTFVGGTGIRMKMFAERLKLLDPLKFVNTG